MVKRPVVVNYTRLVTQMALATWRKLPPQPRRWMDPADLIQEGMLFVKQQVTKWRPHRATFMTFIHISLEQFYQRILAAHYTQKRSKCDLVSVDSVLFRLSSVDPIEKEIHAVESLCKIIKVASPPLRRSIRTWMFTKKHAHFRGEKFYDVRDEMQVLCQYYGFTREDMEFLLLHETWRQQVAIDLNL